MIVDEDLARVEALALAASPDTQWGTFQSDDPAEQLAQFADALRHGTGAVNCVFTPLHGDPDFDVEYTAVTGNGENSEANAKFYSVARQNTLHLINLLRAERERNQLINESAVPELGVWTDGTDTVIAYDKLDVWRVLWAHTGSYVESDLDAFERLPDDCEKTITDDGTRTTKTCREWIASDGRGFLCSTEY